QVGRLECLAQRGQRTPQTDAASGLLGPEQLDQFFLQRTVVGLGEKVLQQLARLAPPPALVAECAAWNFDAEGPQQIGAHGPRLRRVAPRGWQRLEPGRAHRRHCSPEAGMITVDAANCEMTRKLNRER